MDIHKLKSKLKEKTNPEKAEILQRFFKTNPGEYGEGDVFLGLTSQEIKDIAKGYHELELEDVQNLLEDKIHEYRMAAIRILVKKYSKEDKEKIVDFYLKNTTKINNWDLVDTSAWQILGNFLINKDRKILYELSNSDDLWEKRIAIVSTYAFIRENDFEDTLKISETLLGDTHDLIHKAVGWMLREVGKRDEYLLEEFLKKHYEKIARTTLRYAIEKFEEEKRKRYLRGEF